MQRVRLDALQDRAGTLYRDGEPFDGIAYEVNGDRMTANFRVIGGIRGGPAEVWAPDHLRVLYGALDLIDVDDTNEAFPEAGAYLDGVLFDGIAYAFWYDTGVLRAEDDLHPTRPGPSREWYPSGALEHEFDRPRDDGTTESERWHENGQSAGIESAKGGFGVTEEGYLRTLQMESGYPESNLGRMPCRVDSILDLAGPGVTDAVLARLEDLTRVVNLELSRTSISAAGLERFHSCTGLKKLTTRNNAGFAEADVRKLLARVPGCKWDPKRKCPRCGHWTYSGTAWMPEGMPEEQGMDWMKCPGCGYITGE